MVMSFMRSSRKFMMRVLVEILINKRWKIGCGIGVEGDVSSVLLAVKDK